MRKKNVYNQGYFKPSEDQIEEKVIGKDIDFSQMAENKIMDLESAEVDFESLAYLANFKTVNILDEDNQERSVLMLIFYDQSGRWFRAYQEYDPYFYVKCQKGFEYDVMSELEMRFQNEFSSLKIVEKMDLEELNHLSGLNRAFIKLSFPTFQKMNLVRKLIQQKLREYDKKIKPKGNIDEGYLENKFELIEDLFEHDLPYSARVCIDLNIRVSYWYHLMVRKNFVVKMIRQEDLVERPDFTILAFDIETTKEPLKFPDPDLDSVILISYVINEDTFLIVNREICSKDVTSFDFKPTEGIETTVTIFNEKNEEQSLRKFFNHIRSCKPLIITSYNGDFFDFPFIEKRAEKYGMTLEKEIGITQDQGGKYIGKYFFIHLDCFYWVKRDAFLPHGSHGLKAVTQKKLGYSPIEVDPEEMVSLAYNDPQRLCEYSVSDAVATYYLYIKNVHDFIFALCTIIPMNPDDVLRRGSGTLCENLLMAQAFSQNIIFPNKQTQKYDKFYKGFLIESETYVGGYVECLNNGIYRADIETQFHLSVEAYEDLIENTQKILEFFIEVEKGESIDEVENLLEVKEIIQQKLGEILNKVKESPNHKIMQRPLIYHVDVASMYPNIILTNRLQPTAIVNNKICSNCVFNEAQNNCKRPLGWDWKVTYYPFTQSEYEHIKASTTKPLLKQAIKTYSQKNYKTMHRNVIEYKEDVVCMRENPFYVDTIRDFRDLRYKYKGLSSYHNKQNQKGDNSQDHKMLSVYYDSLQLAHKIILNSFYGYVMKKGARWYSMEMAAMVTYMGAKIIQESKKKMDALGKPLELDTDGIWTLLPQGFPETFEIKLRNNKTINCSFPCSLLNQIIYDQFKNNQYQQISDPDTQEYKTRSEMSIFFEIDGPYKAMIIPAAREENKKLKKRYCVFNFQDKITEIKGFEIKRRGELEIVKNFQQEIFHQFLKGDDLPSLYHHCAQTARKWLHVIMEKGKNIDDRRILDLFGQLKVLSRSLEEYNTQKSVAITAAQRLQEVMGNKMMNTSGLNCNFIISKKPEEAQLSARAIPTLVFQVEKKKQQHFLQKWLKVGDDQELTLKGILDWDYYFDRFVTIVQKIITIPAILQNVENPIPEIPCPDWLNKRVNEQNDPRKQLQITNLFQKIPKTIEEIESYGRTIQTQLQHQDLIIEEQKNEKMEKQMEDLKGELKNLKLKVLKKKWKEEREKRQKNTLESIHMENGDIGLYGAEQDGRIKRANWFILKIQTQKDEKMKYWILIDNRVMITKPVSSLRKIYVNSYIPSGDESKISQKKLPREKQAEYLFEYEINEVDFQETMSNMNYFLTNPNYEGVYETQVDPDFRAISKTGNLCRINPKFQKENNLDLSHLECLKNYENPSFFGEEIFSSKLKLIYVWNIQIRKKQMSIIFTPDSIAVLQTKRKELGQENKLPFKNQIQSQLNKIVGKISFPNLQILPIKYETVDEGQDFLQATLKQALIEKGMKETEPCIFIVESNNKKFLSAQSVLIKAPCLVLQYQLSNNNLKEFSSLDWYLKSLELGMEYLIQLPPKIHHFEALSSFAKIPLGNCENSFEMSLIRTIDILFSRELDSNFCVWWFSKQNYPDLGTNQMNEIEGDDIFTSQESRCEVSQPFIADHYVFEIDIMSFHFNTLIVTEINNPLTSHQTMKKTKKDRAEFSISNLMGFNIIKDLFLKWYKEAIIKKNPIADQLLRNLVRWMCDENSYFYDPYLKQTLDQKTKQMFNEFQMELRELGVKVIFASPYKLLISTKKHSYYSASNYVKYVLQSIVENNKFSYIQMIIVQTYKILVFKDIYNYAGVTVDLNALSEQQEIPEEQIYNLVGYFSKWKMKSVFPQPVHKYFDRITKSIVECMYETQKSLNKGNIKISDHQEQMLTKLEQYLNGTFISDMSSLLNYLREQIRLFNFKKEQVERESKDPSRIRLDIHSQNNQEFEQDSYEEGSFIVNDDDPEEQGPILDPRQQEIEMEIEEDEEQVLTEENWSFPNVAGQKIIMENLPLELVKTIFEIFVHENHYLKDTFIKVKKELLGFLNVNYFAEESKYKELFVKLEIFDIVCKECYLVMNIDIFQNINEDGIYRCQCGEPYETYQIENKIIQLIKDCLKRSHQPQFYCSNCKSIKEDFFFERCMCGGQFVKEENFILKEFEEEKKGGFSNFKALAALCEFHFLRDFLQTIC